MTSAHSAEDTEQYRLIRAGDIDARNRMAERHLGLVQKVVTYYAKRNPLLDIDDMLQEGRFGIIIALEKFDPDSGYRFSTYAMWWIKHFVQRYVVSNHSRAASTSKKDTEAFIAGRMEERDAALYEQRCMSHVVVSSEIDGKSIGDTYPSNDRPVDECTESLIQWQEVREALFHPSITTKQRTVICMRYGILGYNAHRIGEIADKMGVTKQAISSAEHKGLANLYKLMEKYDERE